jgi:SAM-dependent methyltransferase
MPGGSSNSPSAWVQRWAGLIPAGGRVLDLAAGSGRHTRYLAGLRHPVEALDIDIAPLAELAALPGVALRRADVEQGPWPYGDAEFAGIVVTNYLHRPLFPDLLRSLAHGGVLIYETFALGNERYGRPGNPNFLLLPGELLEAVRGKLRVVGYEDVLVIQPKSAAVQRICAVRPVSGGFR